MVRMRFLSCLVMALSLFSQGFLLSFSKSVRKAEGDEMLLDTISLGKAFRSGDAADKSMASPLEHFKNDDTSFLDEDEERIAKNLGQKHTFISHSSLPFDMAKKQFPYLALKGPLVFPSDSEDLTIETAQERRDAGEEENSAKLPIGRRDFDMLAVSQLKSTNFIDLEEVTDGHQMLPALIEIGTLKLYTDLAELSY